MFPVAPGAWGFGSRSETVYLKPLKLEWPGSQCRSVRCLQEVEVISDVSGINPWVPWI